MSGRSQFVGSAGQYLVAYHLTLRGIHAAITLGNVPNVDVVASSADGSRLLAIQVKTSRWAHRPTRYGYKDVGEWDVGASAMGRWSPTLWYAFVDLRLHDGEAQQEPRVFLVPSAWVSAFVKPEHSRKMYMLRSLMWPSTLGRWDRVEDFMRDDPAVMAWCSTLPHEEAVW